MRHIDFGVPERFRRWRAEDESGLAKPGLAGRGYTDTGRRDADFGAAVTSIQVRPSDFLPVFPSNSPATGLVLCR